MVRPAVGQCILVLTCMCLPRQNNQECVDLGLEVHLHLPHIISYTRTTTSRCGHLSDCNM